MPPSKSLEERRTQISFTLPRKLLVRMSANPEPNKSALVEKVLTEYLDEEEGKTKEGLLKKRAILLETVKNAEEQLKIIDEKLEKVK